MKTTRRAFLLGTAAAPVWAQSLPRKTATEGSQPPAGQYRSPAEKVRMSSRERVDKVLRGEAVDRPPFSHWHHFGLEKQPPEKFAQATLDYQRKFHIDVVKVMSDFAYPADGQKVYDNPFSAQIKALELIRDGLAGQKHFVETIFNPYKVAENLLTAKEVASLRAQHPQRLHDLLGQIAKSEANHARRAIATGASGIFLAIANAQRSVMTLKEYNEFSEPYDRMVLTAAAGAPLNILHLHGESVYLNAFTSRKWNAAINYSVATTGIPLAEMRSSFPGILLGGIDEVNYRKLTVGELVQQTRLARKAAGAKFILTPGCSVPNDSTDEELMRLPQADRAVIA